MKLVSHANTVARVHVLLNSAENCNHEKVEYHRCNDTALSHVSTNLKWVKLNTQNKTLGPRYKIWQNLWKVESLSKLRRYIKMPKLKNY